MGPDFHIYGGVESGVLMDRYRTEAESRYSKAFYALMLEKPIQALRELTTAGYLTRLEIMNVMTESPTFLAVLANVPGYSYGEMLKSLKQDPIQFLSFLLDSGYVTVSEVNKLFIEDDRTLYDAVWRAMGEAVKVDKNFYYSN